MRRAAGAAEPQVLVHRDAAARRCAPDRKVHLVLEERHSIARAPPFFDLGLGHAGEYVSLKVSVRQADDTASAADLPDPAAPPWVGFVLRPGARARLVAGVGVVFEAIGHTLE